MDEALRAELLRRVDKDQAARLAHDSDAWGEADRENLPWLRGVIAAHGWPGTSLVGPDGAHAAWLLVQHADADPGFQRRCLDLMTAAVQAGEATQRDLAYLTDRVLLAEGSQQEYGTQLISRGGTWVPRNLRDLEGVDERRAAAGLGPLAEHLASSAGRPPFGAWLTCPRCGARVEFNPPDNHQSVTVTCSACEVQMEIFGS
jgi:hypothetical protein